MPFKKRIYTYPFLLNYSLFLTILFSFFCLLLMLKFNLVKKFSMRCKVEVNFAL
jgi:hypothetical protein